MSCYKCARCSCKTPVWVRFEFTNFYSDKFWEYQRVSNSNDLYVRYGRVGTNGTKILKEFDYNHEREDYIQMKVKEKVREGYERA